MPLAAEELCRVDSSQLLCQSQRLRCSCGNLTETRSVANDNQVSMLSDVAVLIGEDHLSLQQVLT